MDIAAIRIDILKLLKGSFPAWELSVLLDQARLIEQYVTEKSEQELSSNSIRKPAKK